MRIINKTKNAVISENAITADTIVKRIKGLLGKNDFHGNSGLILKPCNSIHTFFMQFPIDVLFVDKNNCVVKAISALKPFRFSGICFSASFAIELPAGKINSTVTSIGDTLLIDN